jgi:hypothetical protein
MGSPPPPLWATPFHAFVFVLLLVWTVFLWAAVLYKIATSGFGAFIQYFTSWMLSLNAVFFGADMVARYVDFVTRERYHAHRTVAGGPLMWLTFAVSWVVFVLVFLMIADNPAIFTNAAMMMDVSLAAVYIGDRVEHVIPAIIISLYLAYYWPAAAHHAWWIRHTEVFSTAMAVAQVAMEAFGWPLLFVAFYFATFDAAQIYMLNWYAPYIALGLTLFVLGIVVLIYLAASSHQFHDDFNHLHAKPYRERRVVPRDWALNPPTRTFYVRMGDDPVATAAAAGVLI